MSATMDIFNPQVSVIAKGLEGKTIMIYGGNNVGKTYVAARLSNPFFIAAESGLNAQSGVKYNRINSWNDFTKLLKQFTSKATVDKAREMYDTIVIDEVYALSLMCQDYVISTYGNGALTLGDNEGKINLYQEYEKLFFKSINTLLSCNYTVVFIGHAVEKEGYVSPKGDKRCLEPIINNCDFVVYVKSNGTDENGKVIHSSAYLAETKEYFARSRYEHCPTVIKEFTAENFENAVIEAIENEEKYNNAKLVTYDEQKAQNITATLTYDEAMAELKVIGRRFAENDKVDVLTEIVEETLGVGKRVTECTKRQLEAMLIILDNLKDKAEELNIAE